MPSKRICFSDGYLKGVENIKPDRYCVNVCCGHHDCDMITNTTTLLGGRHVFRPIIFDETSTHWYDLFSMTRIL